MKIAKQNILSIGFYGILIIMLLSHFTYSDIAPFSSDTNAPPERPSLTREWGGVAQFSTKFETWYSKTFPWRNLLLWTSSHFRNFVLKTPSSESVLFGKNNRLFFRGQNNIEGYENRFPMTNDELNSLFNRLYARGAELKKNGILYVVVVSPNPQTIYPEDLPLWVKQIHPQSRIDQLMGRAKGQENFLFVDLRPGLREAKSVGNLYYLTDTHWNDLGGYFAYSGLLKAIQNGWSGPGREDLTPLPLDAYEVKQETRLGGDLANMLSSSRELAENIPLFEPKTPSSVKMSENLDLRFTEVRETILAKGGFTAEQSKNYTTQNPKRHPTLRLLALRDSYFTALTPFLSENFHEAKYLWNDGKYEEEEVKKFHPTVVIQEIVERSFGGNF